MREAGLMARAEEIDLTNNDARLDVLLKHGPGGKVPMLVTDSGDALCESLLICKYLDEVAGGVIYPSEPSARVRCLAQESTASVLLDSLFTRSRENRRPEEDQSATVIAFEVERAKRCYDALEQSCAALGARADNGGYSVVIALGYANFRHPNDGWRDGRPSMAAVYDELMQRRALADTAPVF